MPFALIAAIAAAMSSPRYPPQITLHYTGNLRHAVMAICDQAGCNYSLESRFSSVAALERVSINLDHVSFRPALETTLRGVDLSTLRSTYRVENGVYNIALANDDAVQDRVVETEPGLASRGNGHAILRAHGAAAGRALKHVLRVAGANYIVTATALPTDDGPQAGYVAKALAAYHTLDPHAAFTGIIGVDATPANAAPDAIHTRVWARLDNADALTAIRSLCVTAHVRCQTASIGAGTVTLSLSDVSWRTALETVLRSQGNLTYRVDDGLYEIRPKSEPK
jgi:hypothetical protein